MRSFSSTIGRHLIVSWDMPRHGFTPGSIVHLPGPLGFPLSRHRLDVQDGRPVPHVQTFDTDNAAFDAEDFHDRHADRIRPDWRTDTEHAQRLVAVRRRLYQKFMSELRAFVKIEKHDNALTGLDVFTLN